MALPLRQVSIQFEQQDNAQYCSNRITTAKYGYSSFFPKFFYEQFRRYSNIFFTFIALFQQIPDVSPTGRYTTAVPLLCILGVSAIKELFEDMKRHKADRKVNENDINVLNKLTLNWDLKRWQDVKVGDIIKCINQSFFPSDLLLLCSSEPNGMCYIETANLDGETNLKIRQSLPSTARCSSVEELKKTLSMATVECDPPNPRLYEFEGRLLMPNNVDTYPLGPDNILLRGAKLRNTRWVQGVVLYTGHESKLMINSMEKTPIKQSRLEKLTNIQILWLVFILLATGFLSAVFSQIWASGHMDFMKAFILADKVELQLGFGMTFLTFVILYNNLVPISLQVSLEVVRTFQAHFINSDLEMYDKETDTFAMARTSNLNEELGQVKYILSDKTGTLTKNVMKFKKCSVNGRIYDETTFNLMAESAQNEIPSDYNLVCQTTTNTQNDTQLITTQSSSTSNLPNNNNNDSPRRLGGDMSESCILREFLTLLSVCHTVVPQRDPDPDRSSGEFISKAEEAMKTSKGKQKLTASSSSKSTPNQTLHKRKDKNKRQHVNNPNLAFISQSAGVSSVGEELEITPIDASEDIDLAERIRRNDEHIIAISNSNSSTTTTTFGSTNTILYHAASPDEGALVRGVQAIGYEFTNRTPKYVYVSKFGVEERYDLLHVFEFDSFRKRMSVVIRTPQGKIKIYTKGADSVILEILNPSGNNSLVKDTRNHLEHFAHDGFRTLCCAYAEIEPTVYDQWAIKYDSANFSFGDDKLRKLELCQQELEQNLTLLGATAIEDKLQDDVPETIDILLRAGINFWLLTGDKQETAINIGYSCKLLSREMPLVVINQESYDLTRGQIITSRSSPETALVIDGRSLQYALSGPEITADFMRIALQCKSVICCRVSPFQKARMVQLVKQITGQVTLAIGDGANDVAMIRTANVGIGISGNEGLQAAHSADYTISQFKFLARLLLVHGSWSMSRLRQMILYSFYKNIALYVVEFWFAIVSAWSGQTIFERWTIGLYNVIFTAAPPFAIGVFDRRCSAHLMLKYPQLYKQHIETQSFAIRSFWAWIATAFWHSLLLFWFTYGLIDHDALWSNGRSDGGHLVFGNILYTYVVITVCLKAGLEMHSWTILTHLAIWGSILSWFVFLIIYSRLWPTFPIAADMVSIDKLVFGTWVFWLGLVLVPFTALMADLIYKVIRKTCYRTLADEIVGFEKLWEKESSNRLLDVPLQLTNSHLLHGNRVSSKVNPSQLEVCILDENNNNNNKTNNMHSLDQQTQQNDELTKTNHNLNLSPASQDDPIGPLLTRSGQKRRHYSTITSDD